MFPRSGPCLPKSPRSPAKEPDMDTTDIAKHYPGLSDLQAKAAEWGVLTTETPKGYEDIRLAIAECRGARVAVEAKRKELKAESLEYGRRVDAAARDFTAIVEGIEAPLQAKKDAADAEKERVRQEKAEAERKRIEEELRVKREAEEAQREEERRIRAEEERKARELEEARLEQERIDLAARRKAWLDEQARIEAENKAKRDEEAAILAAERAKFVEEHAAAAAESARLRKDAEDRQRAADEAEARVRWAAEQEEARKRAEAEAEAKRLRDEEAAAVAEAQRLAREEEDRIAAAERKARIEALRPDAEKAAAYVAALAAVPLPAMGTDTGREVVTAIRGGLMDLADRALVALGSGAGVAL